MSIVARVPTYVQAVCTNLATSIETAKKSVHTLLHINYQFVSSILSCICDFGEFIVSIVDKLLFIVQTILSIVSEALDLSIGYLIDLFHVLYSGVLFIGLKLAAIYDSVVGFPNCVYNSISNMTFQAKTSVIQAFDGIALVIHSIVASIVSLVMAVYMFFANIATFCTNVVTGVWHSLGFILSSIAYFPLYCLECVESAKNRIIDNIYQAFAAIPKEGYLGVICLCLLYFTLRNSLRYLNSYCSKLRLRFGFRRRPNSLIDWQIDRDFESDFEDTYASEEEEGGVWMIPRETYLRMREDREENLDASQETDSESEDDNSSFGDEDDDISSDESATIISDDSDSDGSLNSQTLSIESSEREIEVNLPVLDEGYALRSRSSTPCNTPKALNSIEDYERQMEMEKDKRKCVVCQDMNKSVLVLPCRHMCLCVICANHIVRSRSSVRRVCPLCRTKIEKVMDVFV